VFYSALLKVKGWQQMRVTDAAQAVQRSATPEAYERWADNAAVLSRALHGDASGAVACTIPTDSGSAEEPGKRGAAAAAALATGLKLDWGKQLRTAPGAAAVDVAVPVTDARVGWQYAHWLVAHAEEHGVRRVAFGGREWTATAGAWATVSPSPAPKTEAPGQRVLAEVYA
jgi:hypothetical protein